MSIQRTENAPDILPTPDPTDPRFAGVVAATTTVCMAEDRCRQYSHAVGYHQALARTAKTVKKRQAAEETAGHAQIACNEAYAEFRQALADAYNAVLAADRAGDAR